MFWQDDQSCSLLRCFFNESNNYIVLMCPKLQLINICASLRSKLGSIIDMNNINIYICLGSIKCVKKDLAITNDNDVKWVYHIITSNVERHIVLIVHSVDPLSISLDSSSSSSFQTQVHDDRG